MASISLNVGLKALLTAQSALDTVGHNVSNANTPGYSRQNLLISASPALYVRGLSIGNGVQADQVLRTADNLLTRRLVSQTSSIQQLETRLDGMTQIESLFGEPGERGLNSLLQGFFSSISALAASPEDAILRTGLAQSTEGLTARFRELAGSLTTTRKDAAGQVEAQVDNVNSLANVIGHLNREIGGFEGGAGPANDLRDQRDQALADLGKLINITYSEGSDGAVTVLTNGAVLVGAAHAHEMKASVKADGSVSVTVAGNPSPITVRGGTIGGLVHQSQSFIPGLRERLDTLAHNMILELNRAHSTGIPSTGSFQSLTGQYSVRDQDNDGQVTDELLSNAQLPFDVQGGALYVNVSAAGTTSFRTTRIDIDPASTTVGDLLDSLNAIPGLSAALDSSGRVQISADQGLRFDFSRRVDPQPDADGTFGGVAASLGAGLDGPYNLAPGDTLAVTGPGGAFNVTFNSTDFADITQATAAEIAQVLNSNASVTSSGMRAVVTGERVALQSLSGGASTSFTVSSGSALAALGWTAGTTVSGQDHSVDVAITGSYTGTTNERYTFVPSGDGTIGTTPGLSVSVLDASGAQVASLDVGAGYRPGAPLDLPNGLEVSFGLGQLSSTDHDQLSFRALADSDSSDVLVALGLNSLLVGTDASDIALRADIGEDPGAIAASMTGAGGDNTTLNDLLATQRSTVDGLGGRNMGEYYGDIVGGVGFDIASTTSARDVDQFLFDSLSERRQQISGVSVDEELVNMIQFQQSYSAAAQYIQVVNRVNEDILNLI